MVALGAGRQYIHARDVQLAQAALCLSRAVVETLTRERVLRPTQLGAHTDILCVRHHLVVGGDGPLSTRRFGKLNFKYIQHTWNI
jgi:hypothetical protein